MESNLYTSILKMSGNSNAESVLLISDLFQLLPGSFDTVTSHFENNNRIAVYTDDGMQTGSRSTLRHQSMEGYADDLIHFLLRHNLTNITYLAHSVNALLVFTAARKAPYLFDKIVLVNAFPSLRSDPQSHYSCGFPADSVSDLFSCLMLQSRVIVNTPEKKDILQLTDVLAKRFSWLDIGAAQAMFKLLLTTDCRDYLSTLPTQTLILQSASDKFSTTEIGYFMHRTIPDSRLLKVRAKGHLPQLTASSEIVEAINFFNMIPVC